MGISEILKKYSKSGNKKVVNVHSFELPVGKMIAGADDDYLYFVVFEDSKNIEKTLVMIAAKLNCSFLEEKNKLLNQFENEVNDYFEGKLQKFTVPIKTFGSQFQKVCVEVSNIAVMKILNFSTFIILMLPNRMSGINFLKFRLDQHILMVLSLK